MKTEIGICRGCGLKKPIVNKKYFLGPECNRKRLHPDEEARHRKYPLTPKECYPGPKKKRFDEKFPYSTQWGFKSEMEMYRWIAQNRPPVSFFTGKPIPGELKPWNFLHVLPKAKDRYPHFRFNPDNIILGTIDEHTILDTGSDKQKKSLPNWKRFQIKHLQLLADYIKEFGDPKTQVQKLR